MPLRNVNVAMLDRFVRDNLYLVCQIERVWLRMDPRNDMERELLEKFIVYAYRSRQAWYNNSTASSRPKLLRAATATIQNWLTTNYPTRQVFDNIERVIYSNSLTDVQPRGLEVPDDDCGCRKTNRHCATNDCCNRGSNVECVLPCPASGELCKNQESQRDFNWRELFSITLINRDVGAGVVAVRDLEKGSYLGTVVGVALTKAESDERRAQGAGNYLFKVGRDQGDIIHSIDTLEKGNYSRFFNHSCRPNMNMDHWSVGTKYAIKFYASGNIDCVSWKFKIFPGFR